GPQGVEVLAKITRVIRFVKSDRKQVKNGVVIGFIAGLQRIDQNQRPAGPEHATDLRCDRPPNGGRQLVEQIYAGDDIELRVRKLHRLGRALDQSDPRPRLERAPGDVEVVWRKVEAGDKKAR